VVDLASCYRSGYIDFVVSCVKTASIDYVKGYAITAVTRTMCKTADSELCGGQNGGLLKFDPAPERTARDIHND
jgi:hypothetical protein